MANRKEAMMKPYEMDFKEPLRRPEIMPKVRDYIKIKSKEWYDKWKDSFGNIRSFTPEMSSCCGKIFPVEIAYTDGSFHLSGAPCCWEPEFFEEVYPQEKYHIFKLGDDYAVHPKWDPMSGVLYYIEKEEAVPHAIRFDEASQKKEKSKLKLVNSVKPIKLKKV